MNCTPNKRAKTVEVWFRTSIGPRAPIPALRTMVRLIDQNAFLVDWDL